VTTTMSATDLATFVRANDTDAPFVEQSWDQAVALIAGFVGTADVPAEVLQRATLEVGAELFHRRATKNGVAQFATPDAAPVRIARDPMVAAYPLLAPFVGGGFA